MLTVGFTVRSHVMEQFGSVYCLTSKSTIFQSSPNSATASLVFNQKYGELSVSMLTNLTWPHQSTNLSVWSLPCGIIMIILLTGVSFFDVIKIMSRCIGKPKICIMQKKALISCAVTVPLLSLHG